VALFPGSRSNPEHPTHVLPPELTWAIATARCLLWIPTPARFLKKRAEILERPRQEDPYLPLSDGTTPFNSSDTTTELFEMIAFNVPENTRATFR